MSPHLNGICPKCREACEYHPVMTFAPPSLSFWRCGYCGDLRQYDARGIAISYGIGPRG
jgi:hypothetical protein